MIAFDLDHRLEQVMVLFIAGSSGLDAGGREPAQHPTAIGDLVTMDDVERPLVLHVLLFELVRANGIVRPRLGVALMPEGVVTPPEIGISGIRVHLDRYQVFDHA